MAIINERMSIVSDEAMNIYFPQIISSNSQLVLLYEASKELHKATIKDKIVEFLIIQNAQRITAYVNSSMYFRLSNVTSKRLVKLNNDFKLFVEPLEKLHKGKLFWIFNELATYTLSDEEEAKGIERVAMLGRGNRSLKDNFEADVSQLKLTI